MKFDKNKLSYIILKHLHKNNCIGFCDIKPFLIKQKNKNKIVNESLIKFSIASLRENKWIETSGEDWAWLGGNRDHIKIVVENAYLQIKITELGIKHYIELFIVKRRYAKTLTISIIAITFTAIGLIITIYTKYKADQLEKKQEIIQTQINKFSTSLNSHLNYKINYKIKP